MATVKDVAEKAGVSTGTVDRILHNRGRFSKETARRVYAAVKELDYEPNLLARNLSISQTCRLAVILPEPEQDSCYWQLPLSGMKRAVKELNAYQVKFDTFHYNRYDSSSYSNLLEHFSSDQYDGLVLAPLLEEPSRAFLLNLKIPYVFIDTDLPGMNRLAYTGQNSLAGGELAAKLLTLLARGRRGPFLIIKPRTENIHLAGRIGGFTRAISREYALMSTGIEAVHNRQEYFRRLDDMKATRAAGLYVVDASAHYAAAYLRERGVEPIPLIGFDLVEKNKEALGLGIIDFILTQQPEEQGYQGIRLLYRMIMLGEKTPGDQIMTTHIVTRENLEN